MKTLDEIKRLMVAGDIAQAEEALKVLLAKEPGDLEAKMLYGIGGTPTKSSFTARMPQSFSCNDGIAVAVSPLAQGNRDKRLSNNLTMKEFARIKRMIVAGDEMEAKGEVERILAADSCAVRDKKLCAILFFRMCDFDRFDEIKDEIDALNPHRLDGDRHLDKLLEGDLLRLPDLTRLRLAPPMMEYVINAIMVSILVVAGISCVWYCFWSN